jgi:hypothetical protein
VPPVARSPAAPPTRRRSSSTQYFEGLSPAGGGPNAVNDDAANDGDERISTAKGGKGHCLDPEGARRQPIHQVSGAPSPQKSPQRPPKAPSKRPRLPLSPPRSPPRGRRPPIWGFVGSRIALQRPLRGAEKSPSPAAGRPAVDEGLFSAKKEVDFTSIAAFSYDKISNDMKYLLK